MTKAERLLALMQLFRQQRYAVSGQYLAEQLHVSVRTVYRDIASLQSQGAKIEGSAGIGFTLLPGFQIPPLMFTELELEALALGVRWVADRTDPELADAARQLAGKIAAVLPAHLRIYMDSAALLVGPGQHNDADTQAEHLIFKTLRQAIRQETAVEFNYCDLKQQHTHRLVWPFAIGYFDTAAILVAWCTNKHDFRHFRLDRISACINTEQHYPTRRLDLFTQWQTQANIHPTDRF